MKLNNFSVAVLMWCLSILIFVGTLYLEGVFFNIDPAKTKDLITALETLVTVVCIVYIAKLFNDKGVGGLHLKNGLRAKISNAYYNSYVFFILVLETFIHFSGNIGAIINFQFSTFYWFSVVVAVVFFIVQLLKMFNQKPLFVKKLYEMLLQKK
jgi:hypothetical protein